MHARRDGARGMKKTPIRFDGGGVNEEITFNRPPPTELTVERIPALVREVDKLMQALLAVPFTPGTSEAMDASEELMQRAEDVDEFRQSLRPGPLQEIVGKQVQRIEEAAQHLLSSRVDLVPLGVDKPRTRPVPIRVTPFMGSALARAAAKVGVSARKQHSINSVRKPAAKPLYKWEKRRFLHGSTVAQPNVAAAKTRAGRKPKPAEQEWLDDVDEAATELRQCSEPGHYTHSPAGKAAKPVDSPRCFEFQVVLTEEEFKSLKFQRRRLEAEQRHLSRRQKA